MRGSLDDSQSPNAYLGSLASPLAVESLRALKGGKDDEIVVGSAYLSIREAKMELKGWLIVTRLRRGRNLGERVQKLTGFADLKTWD
jgi:hypothetical protein